MNRKYYKLKKLIFNYGINKIFKCLINKWIMYYNKILQLFNLNGIIKTIYERIIASI